MSCLAELSFLSCRFLRPLTHALSFSSIVGPAWKEFVGSEAPRAPGGSGIGGICASGLTVEPLGVHRGAAEQMRLSEIEMRAWKHAFVKQKALLG